MRKALLVSSLLFLLVGSEFKSADTVAIAETTPPVLQPSQTPASTAPVSTPQVTLFNPGATPRQPLRFKPSINAKQQLTVKLDMNVAASVGGETLPDMKFPSSLTKVDITITKVDENGDIHSQFDYTEADIIEDPNMLPALTQTMRQQIKALVGTKGTSISDNRGNIKSTQLVFPADIDPIAKQIFEQLPTALNQFSTPFPEEEIGIGAQWQVSTPFSMGGIQGTQTATYELLDFKNNAATLKVTVQQQASPQAVTLPSLPSGMTASLKSYNSQGNGQLTVGLEGALPLQSTLSLQSNSEINAKQSGNAPETTIGTQLWLQISVQSQ